MRSSRRLSTPSWPLRRQRGDRGVWVRPSATSATGTRVGAAGAAAPGEGVVRLRLDSPLGPLVVAVSARGVRRITADSGRQPPTKGWPGQRGARANGGASGALSCAARARRELAEYFRGERRAFTVPVDLGHLSGFARFVLGRLCRVPYGRTTTYGGLARAAGRARAARAVGRVLAANPVPIIVPCHRVVAARGSLGGYTGGRWRKLFLLRLEGAPIARQAGAAGSARRPGPGRRSRRGR